MIKEKRKVIFATTNPAKIHFYAEVLKEKGYEILTLKDLEETIPIEENGKNAVENAIIKAKTCYQKTGITSIGIDDNLYFEGIKEEKQPGNNVRRVQGKSLTDEEMIVYYTDLVTKMGGRIKGTWIHGIAICKEGNITTYETKSDKIFTNQVSKKRTTGYPLDSITINLEYGKYESELTKQEEEQIRKTKRKEVFAFIFQTLEGV